MNSADIIAELHSLGNQTNREGMARFGIRTQRVLGISMPRLRHLSRRIGKHDHALAQELWETGLHEARILATLVDDPQAVTEEQMEQWVADFDSWDLCDQCCGNLFDKTALDWEKATSGACASGSTKNGPDLCSSPPWLSMTRKRLMTLSCRIWLSSSARGATAATLSKRQSTGNCARSA